jgi:hypothetical protein
MAGNGKTVDQHDPTFAWTALQPDPSLATADKLY